MGFLPAPKRLLSLLPPKRQSLLFSATFSDDIKKLAGQLLKNPLSIEVARRNAPADLVSHQVYEVAPPHKRALLGSLVRTRDMKQVLVFVRMKRDANRLARELVRDGINATAIHSDRTQAEREQALADFKEGRATLLVATDIAARGIDIEELPFVVNYQLPDVPEDCVHRIGRTGRAGTPGEAISLVSHDELKLLADIEKLLKRPIPRIPVDAVEEEHKPHRREREHARDRDHEHASKRDHNRSPREHARHEHGREKPAESRISKAVHDGFDFTKPYEPGEPSTVVNKPVAPAHRPPARPVAALLGGFSLPQKSSK